MIDWTEKKSLLIAAALLIALGLIFTGLKSRYSGQQPGSYGQRALLVGDIIPYSRSRDHGNSRLDSAATSDPSPSHLLPQRGASKNKPPLPQPPSQPAASDDPNQALLAELVEKAEFTHDESDETAEDLEDEEELLTGETDTSPESDLTPPSSSAQRESLPEREDLSHRPLSFVYGLPQDRQDEDLDELDEGDLLDQKALLAWAERLLTEPNFAALTQLIAEYQSGLISAAVFYSLVDQMSADEREDIRRLAGIALVSTPSSSSFVRIATLLQTEAYNSSLRQSLELGLTYYKDLNYILALEHVLLREDSNHTLQLAVTQVLVSAEFHLQNSRQRLLDAEQDSSAHSSPSQAEIVFSRFIAPLRNLTEQASDQDITTQAQTTLTYLEDLLGTTIAVSQF